MFDVKFFVKLHLISGWRPVRFDTSSPPPDNKYQRCMNKATRTIPMPPAPEKTVFVSYRRSVSAFIARAIFQDLHAHGYDVFMDVESINSGMFDTIILNQIAARAHFLLILTPGTLERCGEPGDWLRREIECAMDTQRNMVLVMVNEFRFDDRALSLLTGKLSDLPRFNALTMPHEYFDAAMDKLRNRFLKLPAQGQIIPTPRHEETVVQRKIEEAARQPVPTADELSAEEYGSRGADRYEQGDTDGAIADYNEAIRLNPQFAMAYNNRGYAYQAEGDYTQAIADYTRSIDLGNPELHIPYNNRGNAYDLIGDFDQAIADYNEAVRLNPGYADPYYNRALARHNRGVFDGVLDDYTTAIRLKPDYAFAYNNRGNVRIDLGDLQGAVDDYTEAIRLAPGFALAYNNRGYTYEESGDYERALADYKKALQLDPQYELAQENRDRALDKLKQR
jgi:tetratricopeptide (TPR) repeat protein